MESQTRPTRILRIGVVLGGKLVEERLIRKRETVTLGQSAKATFAVPMPELPKKLALFELTSSGYVLNLPDAMDGRISDGDRVYTLAELRQGGAAQPGPRGLSALPLGDHLRGKVTLGELTLLFQFVTPPPPVAKPQLPASVRAGRRVDPYLAATVLLSAALHVGFVLYARSSEDDKRVQSPTVAYEHSFSPPPIVRLPPPPKVPDTRLPGPGITAPNLPPSDPIGHDATAHQPSHVRHDTPTPESDDARKARVSGEVASNVVLDVLGRRTRSGAGILIPGDDRNTSIDVKKALDAANAEKRRWSTTAERGGDTTTQEAPGRKIVIGGPADTVKTGEKKEKDIPIVVPGKPIPPSPTDIPYVTQVAAKIRSAYLGGLRGCFEDGTKQHADMGGRVEIEIEIGPMGTVTHASMASSELEDPRTERAMASFARSWSFGRPPGGDSITITFPFVFHAPK